MRGTIYAGLLLIGLLSACGAPTGSPAATPPPAAATVATSMDHGGHGSMASNAPYDATFIDGMIVHHRGAITMANDALAQSQRPEIQELARAIISAQEAEIAQLEGWRTSWYPDLAPTGGMAMDMGPMAVSSDSSQPFDLRFINAMIPHHEGAIAMANEAQQKASRNEIKQLSGEIIDAQQREIEQMRQWRKAWFNQ